MRFRCHWMAAFAVALGLAGAPSCLFAQDQGDLNADNALDAADVAKTAVDINSNPTDAALKLRLDFNRDGLLTGLDPAFLADVVIGRHGYLPKFSLSDALTGQVVFTREAMLPYQVSVAEAPGAFTVSIDGQVILSGSGSGQASGNFALTEGTNFFSFQYSDSAGNEIVRTVEIRRDTQPPLLSIRGPVQDQTLNSFEVLVTGQALDGENPASVTVNGVPMEVGGDGAWSGVVPFDVSGPRTLTAVALDAAGNEVSVTRRIEVYVSEPTAREDGPGRLDLSEGSFRRRGEDAEVVGLDNADIKSVLGPGSENIVATRPLSGLTEGVIILPSAMMIGVQAADTPEIGLAGDEPMPVFSATPEISLTNDGGATNATPLWIFQIIPDADGNGNPQLALVARAKVAEEGPHAGRIVPIPDPNGEFPGTFNPDVPMFQDTTLPQIQGLPAMARLRAKFAAKAAAREGKQTPPADVTRVTFYCCAASAVVPVKGRVKCGTANLPQIEERIRELEDELTTLGGNLTKKANEVVKAENDRINAVENIAGFTQIPGTDTKVVTFVNGKAFGCLKGFVGPAALLDRIEQVNDVLNTIQDINTIITQQTQPPHEIVLRLEDLFSRAYQEKLLAWGDNATLAEWQANRSQFIRNYDGITFFRNVLQKFTQLQDCATALKNAKEIADSWTVIATSEVVIEAEGQAYDTTLKLFRRYADCKRQLTAAASQAGIDPPVFKEYLKLPKDYEQITADLQTFANYFEECALQDVAWADLADLAHARTTGEPASYQMATELLAELGQLMNKESNLVGRAQDEAYDGFDAVIQTQMIAPAIAGKAAEMGAMAEAATADAIEDKNGFEGASISLQGSGSPFAATTGEGGEFTHYEFTNLVIEGQDPDRNAVFVEQAFTADAQGLSGVLTGSVSGNTGRHVFPFTPFSTVDFNVIENIGDVFIGPPVPDTAGIPPTVQILKPANGANIPVGFPVRVRVSATDDVAVVGSDILVNGVSQEGVAGAVGDAVVTLPDQLGTAQIQAIASDLAGNLGTASVTVNLVSADNSLSISPTDVKIVQGGTAQFTASFVGQDVTNTVIWKVNGFPGGLPAALGTINAGGFYDSSTANTGSPAALIVEIAAELADFPGYEAKAHVLLVDSGDVIAAPVAFSFPAPAQPGGLLSSRPVAFSFPSPSQPGGMLSSRPVVFSFPSPAQPGGLLSSPPVVFQRD